MKGHRRIVAGEVDHVVLVGQHTGAARQDHVHQPQHVRVLDDLGDGRPQDRVIQRGKVLDDVQAQHVAIAPGKLLQPVDGAVRAFADPVGVAVGMKRASNSGSMTLQSAWCTTRSRKGAALILRRFGSWMVKWV